MIHLYALAPEVVASWGRREEYRFVHDKFGLGTPRAMLELPAFTKWKRAVYQAANALALTDADMKRVEELFRIVGEHKLRRADALYDGLVSWLENAEREYRRKPFAAILARENPRSHEGVLSTESLDASADRWNHPMGITTARSAEALATSLSAMLTNCAEVHLVDPHFGPENARHRKVLEAFLQVLAANDVRPARVRVHCLGTADIAFFEAASERMARRLPSCLVVEFVRWKMKPGGDRLHNRYVLTDLGGVSFGDGIDEGKEGQTDDVLLLPRAVYEHRWGQYSCEDGSFEVVDRPTPVRGSRRASQRNAGR